MDNITNHIQEQSKTAQYKDLWKETGGFVFYASMYEAVKSFDEDKQGDLVLWIIEYGLTGEMTDCPKEVRMILKPHLDSIDTQKRRFFNINVVNKCLECTKVLSDMWSNDRSAIVKLTEMRASLIMLLRRCRRNDITMIYDEINSICHTIITKWVFTGYKDNFHAYGALLLEFQKASEESRKRKEAEKAAEYERARIKR